VAHGSASSRRIFDSRFAHTTRDRGSPLSQPLSRICDRARNEKGFSSSCACGCAGGCGRGVRICNLEREISINNGNKYIVDTNHIPPRYLSDVSSQQTSHSHPSSHTEDLKRSPCVEAQPPHKLATSAGRE
jgi:hypothetical protein